MSKKTKPGEPSEVPQPDTDPEIKPLGPEQPVLPEKDPEIIPEKEPDEPSPAEIPVPPKKPEDPKAMLKEYPSYLYKKRYGSIPGNGSVREQFCQSHDK